METLICSHCDTGVCLNCGGLGEVFGLFGHPYGCSDCDTTGICEHCSCSECVHGHGIFGCFNNHEDE